MSAAGEAVHDPPGETRPIGERTQAPPDMLNRPPAETNYLPESIKHVCESIKHVSESH